MMREPLAVLHGGLTDKSPNTECSMSWDQRDRTLCGRLLDDLEGPRESRGAQLCADCVAKVDEMRKAEG